MGSAVVPRYLCTARPARRRPALPRSLPREPGAAARDAHAVSLAYPAPHAHVCLPRHRHRATYTTGSGWRLHSSSSWSSLGLWPFPLLGLGSESKSSWTGPTGPSTPCELLHCILGSLRDRPLPWCPSPTPLAPCPACVPSMRMRWMKHRSDETSPVMREER